MARASRGRKPAKNETAAGLIKALTFCAVIKPPTTTSMPQHHHVWINYGMAIRFDGIVAAGHPVDTDVAGYPDAKLLLEALDNTDKTFSLTVREDGSFEIGSDKYQALVPALAHSEVIPTQPDQNVASFKDGAAFVKAVEAAGRIAVESGDVVLYSSVRLTSEGTAMATDGNTIVEAYHGERTPPNIVLPKQFVTALVKSGKTPVGMGLSPNWDTFTVWFEDSSWLRTATYEKETWPDAVIQTFYEMVSIPNEAAETPVKLWAAVKNLIHFTDDDNRLIIRPGLIRTHPDRQTGAALELAELPMTLDIDGKRLLAVETLASRYVVSSYRDLATFVFFGDGSVRGAILGLPALAEPEQPAQGGWGSQQPAAQGDGWAMTAPKAEPAPSQGWNGIPATGLAGDPEYESERQGIPTTELGVGLNFNSQDFLDGLKDVGE